MREMDLIESGLGEQRIKECKHGTLGKWASHLPGNVRKSDDGVTTKNRKKRQITRIAPFLQPNLRPGGEFAEAPFSQQPGQTH
jgi:hypothetical protein